MRVPPVRTRERLDMTDEALMLAVRNGDLDRLTPLFQRYWRPLFGFFHRMSGDRGLAEDLVQDVFVRVLKYRHTYQDDGVFEAWLFRIARNTFYDAARKRPALEGIDDVDVAETAPSQGQRLEHDDNVARLNEALRRLPADKREVIVLARYRGLTHEQLGALMGVDVGTMRVRLHRALRQLGDIFHDLGGWNTRCAAKTSANN